MHVDSCKHPLARGELPTTKETLYVEVEVRPADEETVVAALHAAGAAGSWTLAPGRIRGYFPRRARRPDGAFREAWRRIADRPCPPVVALRRAAATDWVARWRSTIRPVRISGRLWIAPPDSAPPADPEAVVVRILPGMGFGTGSHPTTRALLRWLDVELGFESVLDVGTGSGVLAIAAARLSARIAVGIDVDPEAVANAAGNRALDPRGDRVALVVGTLDAIAPGARFDRVLANLDAPTLRALLPSLARACAPGGRVGVAGVLAGERNAVVARARATGLRLLDQQLARAPSAGDRWWSGWLGID